MQYRTHPYQKKVRVHSLTERYNTETSIDNPMQDCYQVDSPCIRVCQQARYRSPCDATPALCPGSITECDTRPHNVK
jgi:hypothetical protein